MSSEEVMWYRLKTFFAAFLLLNIAGACSESTVEDEVLPENQKSALLDITDQYVWTCTAESDEALLIKYPGAGPNVTQEEHHRLLGGSFYVTDSVYSFVPSISSSIYFGAYDYKPVTLSDNLMLTYIGRTESTRLDSQYYDLNEALFERNLIFEVFNHDTEVQLWSGSLVFHLFPDK